MVPFLGKRLLFITSHPDDESFLVSGTILKNHEAGGQAFIFCATLGEKGKAHLAEPCTPHQLKRMRKAELITVSRFLKVRKLRTSNIPDGAVKKHKRLLYQKVSAFAAQHKPEYIISFGNDGVTGHLDHIATGQVARRLAKTLRVPFIACCAPPALIRQSEAMKKRRHFGVYHNEICYEQANCTVKVDREQKLQALLHHQSQLPSNNPFKNIPKSVVRQILAYEFFCCPE